MTERAVGLGYPLPVACLYIASIIRIIPEGMVG